MQFIPADAQERFKSYFFGEEQTVGASAQWYCRHSDYFRKLVDDVGGAQEFRNWISELESIPFKSMFPSYNWLKKQKQVCFDLFRIRERGKYPKG